MISATIHPKLRATFLAGALALFAAAASPARAQLLSNLFAGTQSNNTANAAVTVPGTGTTTNTNTLGSGYSGTVTLGTITAVGTITESVNTSSTQNQYVLGTTGASSGDSFSASTNLVGTSSTPLGLSPGTAYQFTLTRSSATTATLINSLNFTLGINGTTFANTATGDGIAGGAVNVIGLFSNGNTATFVFTTPATVTPTSTLNFGLSGSLAANVNLTNVNLTLTSASITPVPEPGTRALGAVGLVGLVAWQARRRWPGATALA